MSCHRCQQASRLDRHTQLVGRELADLREAGRYALTPEEREQLEAEEQLLTLLLERIERERLAPA
jgi:hypothetical protein